MRRSTSNPKDPKKPAAGAPRDAAVQQTRASNDAMLADTYVAPETEQDFGGEPGDQLDNFEARLNGEAPVSRAPPSNKPAGGLQRPPAHQAQNAPRAPPMRRQVDVPKSGNKGIAKSDEERANATERQSDIDAVASLPDY